VFHAAALGSNTRPFSPSAGANVYSGPDPRRKLSNAFEVEYCLIPVGRVRRGVTVEVDAGYAFEFGFEGSSFMERVSDLLSMVVGDMGGESCLDVIALW
jgi:hypothetical protein